MPFGQASRKASRRAMILLISSLMAGVPIPADRCRKDSDWGANEGDPGHSCLQLDLGSTFGAADGWEWTALVDAGVLELERWKPLAEAGQREVVIDSGTLCQDIGGRSRMTVSAQGSRTGRMSTWLAEKIKLSNETGTKESNC